MQAIASKPLAAPSTAIRNVAHKNDWGFLLLFCVAACGLAWLCFGVPILAARGLIASPAPDAVFLTLATLGIALAGIGAAAAESRGTEVRVLVAQVLRWRTNPYRSISLRSWASRSCSPGCTTSRAAVCC